MAKKKIAEHIPELQKDFDEVLLLAAYNKDLKMVQWAINMGANVNAQDSEERTALIRACDYIGSTEIAKILIENGAELNIKGKYSDTPLGYAAMYGHLELVRLLLDSGADVNMKGGYGRTPLHYASTPSDWSEDYLEIVKLLLERGADPNLKQSGGDNALLEALWRENLDLEIIKLLIKHGTNLEEEGAYSSTALSRAAEKGRIDIIKFLENYLPIDDIPLSQLEKTLVDAMKENEKEVVIYLLEKGEKKLPKEFFRVEVLSYAARHGYDDLVNILLKRGLNPQKEDIYYGLGEACYKGHLNVIKLLIEKGADVNGGDYGASENPLMKAARYSYFKIAEFLLDNGANIEARSYEGNTPIQFAAWEGQLEMIKFLVDRGANIDTTNDLNWNALMQACVEGYYEIVEYLIKKGSNIHLIDQEKGATSLMLAAWKCSEQIVKLLLENGIDKKIKDKQGKTAADYARERGCMFIAEIIDKY